MINLGFLKRGSPRIAIFCFLAFSISHPLPVRISDAQASRDKRIHLNLGKINGAEYVEGEVLVKFKPRVSRQAVRAIADSNMSNVVRGYHALTKLDAREYAHLKSKHRTTQQMLQALKKNPQVEAVSPNFILRLDDNIPNDEYFDYLWGLHNTGQMGGPVDIDIKAPAAWDITTGSSSVIVGVIDTGIDYNHPDLSPNIWVNPGEVVDGIDNDGNGYIDDIHGINAIASSGDPMDDHSHGTHCAGIIGAVGNNDLGVVGVNWNVRLIGTKFLDATGYGTDADALECINYLIDLKTTFGQNIVAANASFGGGDYDPVLESAIENMGLAGIVLCAAAGNDYMDNDIFPHYPSSYTCSNIIAVTGVDYMGWQNFNYGATSVDLGAPGVDILSTISAVYYPQAGDIFFDDMESGAGQWVTGGINNNWGITTDQEFFENPDFPVPSPTHFWSDSPGTDYLPDTDSWLMNAYDIDLSGYVGQDLYLGFGSAMFFEALVDHAYLEVSGDSGSTWHTLMDYTEYPIYWYIPLNCLIPDYVKTADFRFRFHLVTDYSIEWPGWLIDDIGIGMADYYSYSFKSGTSMATPHVTGAVALAAAQFPLDTVTERINRILSNVTPLPSLVDTCVTEGMLNLIQIVRIPGTPMNPSPSDGAVGVSVNTILDWDDCPAATSYDVYFGTSPSPSLVSTEAGSTYDPGSLNPNTTYYWRVVAKNSYGETSGQEWSFSTGLPSLLSDYCVVHGHDFDGNLTSDVSLWRPTNGFWYIKDIQRTGFGLPGDIPVSGDYDGNGTTDIAVFRPSTGMWAIKGQPRVYYGLSGDIPVPGDYDGNGITDVAIYRPSTGMWAVKDQFTAYLGGPIDVPVPGDYDGDGDTDVAVFNVVTGHWRVKDQFHAHLGTTGDIPVPADYDGDGDVDVAIFRPAAGMWVIGESLRIYFGSAGDIPTPGDYDGNGTADVAVFRATTGLWAVKDQIRVFYGQVGDIPLVR